MPKFDVEKMATKIVITKRGNCSFVTKVRNAERAGASLLVVVDNNQEDIKNVIMGDDGTGTGIRIPSMLIGKEHGQILID
jgi:minor extracellular serine protease Vpr